MDDAGLRTPVAVTVTITPANAVPTAPGAPSAPTTNPATGVVTGDVGVTDPDGDTLGYSAGTGPAHGSVLVDPVTGRWTYTPTDAARRAAAQGGPTTDTFTVRVTDGHGGVVVVPVTVAISPVATTPGHPTPGHPTPRPCPPGKGHPSPGHHDTGHHAGHHHGHRPVRGHHARQGDHGHRRWVVDLVHHRAALVPTGRGHAAETADRCPTVQVHSIDGRYLWVLDPAAGTVTVIDTRTERVVATILVDAGGTGLDLSTDGTRLVVSHTGGPDTVIDTATRTVVDRVQRDDREVLASCS
ncbi:Ig-like domain-containing protein [Actinomycetospora straminea]|uniref:Ig-like domain-containing protein n=1 Tax=Actinomycetospora straminea TaxID=663607 RepID=UPI003B67BA44